MPIEMYIPCARAEAGLEKYGFDPRVFPPPTVDALRGKLAYGGVALAFGQCEALAPDFVARLRTVRRNFKSCLALSGPADAWIELDERGYGAEELASSLAIAFRGAVVSEDMELLFVPSRAHSPDEELSRVRAALWTTANRYDDLSDGDRALWVSRALANDRQAIDVVSMWAQWVRPLGPTGKSRVYHAQFAKKLLDACTDAVEVSTRVALMFETLHYLPLLEDAEARAMIRAKTDPHVFDESIQRLRDEAARGIAARLETEVAALDGELL